MASHSPESDLDIAVEHGVLPGDSDLFTTGLCEPANWRKQLQPLLRLRLDMQSYIPGESEIVEAGLRESSRLIYENLLNIIFEENAVSQHSMRNMIALLFAAQFSLLGGCDGGTAQQSPPLKISIDFNTASTDWLGGYSDYSSYTQPEDIVEEPRPLPPPFTSYGLYTAGTNLSDDLFIYIKKKFSGFAPNAKYSLTFSVTFLTNAPSGCAGAEGVTMKGGASTIEPITVLVNGEYQMNIDKGIQANSGKDALALGDIINSNTDCSSPRYVSKTLTSSSVIIATADNDGSLWVIFGIDSGFEAASNVYYQSATVAASIR